MARNTATFGQLKPGAPLVGDDIFAIQRVNGLNFNITADEVATFVGAISGITTINGDNTAAQIFTVGTGLTLIDAGATHTFSLFAASTDLTDSANLARNTDKLSFFSATTSLELADVISDETGSGLLVFGTNPTLITPTIASFINANHDHQAAGGGGQLVASSALTATGTPDNTTFLRGDDTWAVIPTFSGNLSDLAIDVNKNWNGKNITNLGKIETANGAGPVLLNIATTATVPVFAFNFDITSGIGSVGSGNVDVIAASTRIMNFNTTSVSSFVDLQMNGSDIFKINNLFVGDTQTAGASAAGVIIGKIGTGPAGDIENQVALFVADQGGVGTAAWVFREEGGLLWSIGENINASNANGPTLLNEPTTSTNSTVNPSRASLLAGLGANSAGDLSLIVENNGVGFEAIRLTQDQSVGAAGSIFGNTFDTPDATITASTVTLWANHRFVPADITGAFTTTDAATIYIPGAPAAIGGGTITNAHALLIASGTAAFGGQILAADGTTALPAYGFSSAAAIGFHKVGNTVIFSGQGTDSWIFSRDSLNASLTTGPFLKNSATSATNPTVGPLRQSPSSGMGSHQSGSVSLIASALEGLRIDGSGTDADVITADAIRLTTAIDGFLYIPTCAGTPTGTPTGQTGTVPQIYDVTNDELYVFNGSWKSVALT